MDEGEKKLLGVSQAAEAGGVSKQTVQYYLMVGLIEPLEWTEGGRQLFDQKTVERIIMIKKLNDSGYPLREIRDIFLQDKTNPSIE